MQYTKDSIRRAILESALQEFYTKGYESASMRSIAEGAGTAPGNLYRYFSGKDELYTSCVFPALDAGIDGIGRIFDVSSRSLAFTAEQMVAFIARHQREYSIIVRGPACHYNAFQARFTACIAQRLKAHVAQTAAPEVSPWFYDSLASAFCSGLREILERTEQPQHTERYVLELLRFLFENFDERVRMLHREGNYDQ